MVLEGVDVALIAYTLKTARIEESTFCLDEFKGMMMNFQNYYGERESQIKSLMKRERGQKLRGLRILAYSNIL